MEKLSQFELDILRRVGATNQHAGIGVSGSYAMVVWHGRYGIEMGPVRWFANRGDQGMYYSCSPFPGAWSDVPEANIIRVRHINALSFPVGE